MPKNIVVFSDGTGQDGGVRPEQRVSNIYKMYRASRVSFDNAVDPAEQVVFYDPGLGTDIEATALTAPVRFVQKLLASVEGRGITTNIADCYEFVINHYEAGDRIFLFGFSRGAYTVRSLANLLRLCGIPTITPDGTVSCFRASVREIAEEATISVLEHGAGHPRAELENERDELARRFRDKYGSHHPSGEVQRSNAAPYFIGVFDTVAALGAHGVRRSVIRTGLALVVGFVGAVAAIIPSILFGLVLRYIFNFPFWKAALGFDIIVSVCAIAYLLHRERRSIKKTIFDYPTRGQSHAHYAEWKGENFDRLLSRFVTYARSANAIDEIRADFERVPWGPTAKGGPIETQGHATFKQFFFAGNHSDIGGSYPEVESRLSDIALAWMFEEASIVPDGLKVGPVFVDGVKMENTGNAGEAIYLRPAENGVQHCEIAAMRDRLDRLTPQLLRRLCKSMNYAMKIREIPRDGTIHPSVGRRFALQSVVQTDSSGPYRPEALRNHLDFRRYYDGTVQKPSI